MTRRMFVLVAGLQPDTVSRLAALFEKTRNEELIPVRRVQCPLGYTEEYVARLYERVAHELKERLPGSRDTLLGNASLTVLYVIRHMVNTLFKEVARVLKNVRAMYSVISEEVNGRDNRTCLLLPPKTFERGFLRVCEEVHNVIRNGEEPDQFRRRLKQVSSTLRVREGKYFVGERGLVFTCPAKATDRHGLAPIWEDESHHASCVIRGRLRFGVPFDPRFHYDCEVEDMKWDDRVDPTATS